MVVIFSTHVSPVSWEGVFYLLPPPPQLLQVFKTERDETSLGLGLGRKEVLKENFEELALFSKKNATLFAENEETIFF